VAIAATRNSQESAITGGPASRREWNR
jgi:hypothetical protein